MAIGSGQNANKAITGTASNAFTQWLHRQYAHFELPLAGSYCFTMQFDGKNWTVE